MTPLVLVSWGRVLSRTRMVALMVLVAVAVGCLWASSSSRAYAADEIFSSDYVEAVVSSTGQFTLGTREGNPRISSDDQRILLFGHPRPWSSFTSVKVGGDEARLSELQVVEQSVGADGSQTVWEFNGVRITQKLKLVTGAVTGRKDTLLIDYGLENTTDESVDAGVRVMLDTMLGPNDGAPFRVPRVGAVTSEMTFGSEGGGSGPSLPAYVQAFDSLESPGVVSHAELLGVGEDQPDRIQIAAWPEVKATVWDYETSGLPITSDSALVVYWQPERVSPNRTRNASFTYGMSQLEQDLRPPLATSVHPLPRTLKNPEDLSVYVYNNGNAEVPNAKVTVELPSGLAFGDGSRTAKRELGTVRPGDEAETATFQVHATGVVLKRRTPYRYSVTVSGEGAATKTLKLKTSVEHNIPSGGPAEPVVPIVLVPGIMGSWNTAALFGQPRGYGDFNWMSACVRDPSIYPPSQDGVWEVDPVMHTYDNLIWRLKASGYVVGKTLFFAPYDWRKPNSESAEYALKPVVKYAKQQSGGREPIIVAHSMGGIVARELLAAEKEHAGVAAVLQLATPNQGSANAYFTFEGGEGGPPVYGSGSEFGPAVVRHEFLELLISHMAGFLESRGNAVRSKCTSVRELMPTYDFLTSKTSHTDIVRRANDMFHRNKSVAALNGNPDANGSEVEILTLAGTDHQTIRYIPVGDAKPGNGDWADGKPSHTANLSVGDTATKDGDDTVPVFSAKLRDGEFDTVVASHGEVAGGWEEGKPKDHAEASLNKVAKYLDLEGHIDLSASKITNEILMMVMTCPVSVQVTDPQGAPLLERSGDASASPTSYFFDSADGSGALAWVPNPELGEYRAVITATDDGTCTASAEFIASSEATAATQVITLKKGQTYDLRVKASKDASGHPSLETTLSAGFGGGGGAGGSSAGIVILLLGVVFTGSVAWVIADSRGGTAALMADSRDDNGIAVSLTGSFGTQTLRGGANRIGRAADNDVVLDDPTVSRQHAVISVGQGALRIRDLGSTSGTKVNGLPVDQAVLVDGDVVSLGECDVVVRVAPTQARDGFEDSQ